MNWRPRFSLRTLLLLVLLIGSAGGLWWHWRPWHVVRIFPASTQREMHLSPDEKNILVRHVEENTTEARVFDVQTGKLIFNIPLDGDGAEYTAGGRLIIRQSFSLHGFDSAIFSALDGRPINVASRPPRTALTEPARGFLKSAKADPCK